MVVPTEVFGVLLSAVCCALAAFGTLLMKHSATVEVDVPLHQRWWWALGVIFMGLLPLPINMVALSLAPVALLAPLGGLTIVFSILLAHLGVLTVRESPSGTQAFAIGVVLVGLALVSGFGPQTNSETEEGDGAVDTVLTCTSNVPFMFLTVLCLCAIATLVGSWLLPKTWKPKSTSASNVALMAFVAAACGAFATLIVKVGGMAVRSLTEDDEGRFPPKATASLIVLGLSLAGFELYLLNSVLASSSVALAVPMFQGMLITLTVATGGTFYREFAGLWGGHIAAFACGAALVITGVVVLSVEPARMEIRSAQRSEISMASLRAADDLTAEKA